MLVRLSLLAAALAAVACSGDGSPRGTTPDPTGSGSAAAAAPPATMTTHRRGGTPHHAAIDRVSISSDGKAVVTRDALGEWRVWPTLDGSVPTQRLPITRTMDAAIGTMPGGLLVAAVDAAQALIVLRLDAAGAVTSRAQVAPDPGFEHVVIAGERVVAARADQAIAVFAPDGKLLGKLGMRGGRVQGLVPASGDKALAIVRRGGPTESFEARWIDLARVAWADTIPLPMPIVDDGDVALSPDGRVLAYLGRPAPVPPAQPPSPTSAPGAPARRPIVRPPPPPSPPSTPVQLAVIDLVTKKQLPVTEPQMVNPTAILGFMAARDLMLFDGSTGSRIAIDTTAGTTTAFGDGLPIRGGAMSFAPGVAVGGQLASLAIIAPDGTTRYLGHKDSAPAAGSLSPSGKTAAWISTGGSLIVEQLDGTTERVIRPDTHTAFSLVEMIDDRTLVVLTNQSIMQMYDVDTGAVLGSTPVTSAAAMQYAPSSGLLLVPAGTTIWLYPLDRASAAPFGRRMVVPESNGVLLDPGATAGAVLLGSDGTTARRYSLEELRAGVSRTMARDKRVTLPAPLFTFDRTGRPYNLSWKSVDGVNGRYLEGWSASGTLDPWNPKGEVVAKLADDASAAVPAPDGSRFLVYDSRGTVQIIDRKGAVAWSAAMPTIPSRISWASDGSRVLIVSQAGGEIFDVASGQSLERACGWRFTSDTSPPAGSPAGVASVCTAPVRR